MIDTRLNDEWLNILLDNFTAVVTEILNLPDPNEVHVCINQFDLANFDAVLSQYNDIELIVGDDGSSSVQVRKTRSNVTPPAKQSRKQHIPPRKKFISPPPSVPFVNEPSTSDELGMIIIFSVQA